MDKPDLNSTIKLNRDILEHFQKSKQKVGRDKGDKAGKSGAYFVIAVGPDTGKVVFIDKEKMILGRGDSADIEIGQRPVSRNHARIETFGKKVTIIDLGSTNGTFINNKRIKKKVLKDGDEIQAGEIIMKFFQEDLEIAKKGHAASAGKADDASEYYRLVLKECEACFGQKTRQFLDRQITAHLGKTLETLDYSDSRDLSKWINISASLILDESRAKKLADRIKSIKK